jgi:hypothetical protein
MTTAGETKTFHPYARKADAVILYERDVDENGSWEMTEFPFRGYNPVTIDDDS